MQVCSVYWIRAPHHSNVLTEGYVGVSKDTIKRWQYGHNGAQKNNRHSNAILSNAIKKYGWNVLLKEIILVSDQEYCYRIEEKLRPKELMGWNIAVGGIKPPTSKSRGEGYISPLKGKSRQTPWLVGKTKPLSVDFCSKGGRAGKGRKQTPEQVAKRVLARRVTLAAQGRTA